MHAGQIINGTSGPLHRRHPAISLRGVAIVFGFRAFASPSPAICERGIAVMFGLSAFAGSHPAMLRRSPPVGGGFAPGRPGRPVEGIPGIDASLEPIGLVASVVLSAGRLVSLVGDLVSLVGGSVSLVTGLVPPITGTISAFGGLVPTVASLVALLAGPIPLVSRQRLIPSPMGWRPDGPRLKLMEAAVATRMPHRKASPARRA